MLHQYSNTQPFMDVVKYRLSVLTLQLTFMCRLWYLGYSLYICLYEYYMKTTMLLGQPVLGKDARRFVQIWNN